MEADGLTLHPVLVVYLRLTDADANVTSVTKRIQEQDSVEPIVVCDCNCKSDWLS
ncbi:hypothetical protein DPMN_181255 [Dreissena polymorpha]|uniref:Uncharacterized protein n=1 Tax=Dreissena polymorpha TaxID=45954 RepID=A0A9D4DD62_DREPO|nr:hypothetical protein DPMN_181255 [Dreissena polymorpha]